MKNIKLKNCTKKTIKELNEKSKIKELRNEIIKELKELIYRQTEKRKSYNTRRRVNRLCLKKIGKRKNLSNEDVEEVKWLNELTTYDLKTIAKLREIKDYNNLKREDLIYVVLRSEEAPQEDNYLQYLDSPTDSELKKELTLQEY